MKHRLISLCLLLAASVASAMTPDEFKVLYEKPGKSAADCYRLFEAYRDGDGTDKDDSKARKWVLAAHESGMISARKDIASLPWRTNGKYKGKPSITIAEVDDETAKALGEELIALLAEHFHFEGSVNYCRNTPADKPTLKAVRKLIADGADLNVWAADSMKGQHSALYIACANRDFRLAKLLIDHGADPSANNNMAVTVSFYSTHYASQEEEKLAEKKANAASNLPKSELKKLAQRRKKSHKEDVAFCTKLVDFLVDNGADLTLYTNQGWTLMFTATFHRSPLGVAMLAKAGLDPMRPQDPHEYAASAGVARDMQYAYRTGNVAEKGLPIFFAVANGCPDVVSQLLKAGTNPNVKDHEGCTPLDHALGSIKANEASPEQTEARKTGLLNDKVSVGIIKRAGGKATGKVPSGDQYMLDHYARQKGEAQAE